MYYIDCDVHMYIEATALPTQNPQPPQDSEEFKPSEDGGNARNSKIERNA